MSQRSKDKRRRYERRKTIARVTCYNGESTLEAKGHRVMLTTKGRLVLEGHTYKQLERDCAFAELANRRLNGCHGAWQAWRQKMTMQPAYRFGGGEIYNAMYELTHGLHNLRENVRRYPPVFVDSPQGRTRILGAWAHDGTREQAPAHLREAGVPFELHSCGHGGLVSASGYVAVRPAGLKTLFLWQASFPGVMMLLSKGETVDAPGYRALVRETARAINRFDREARG